MRKVYQGRLRLSRANTRLGGGFLEGTSNKGHVDQNYKMILERITNLLKQQGKMQKDLIEYLNLPKGTYSNWQRCISYSFLKYMDSISAYLGVSVTYLMTGEISSLGQEIKEPITDNDIEIIKIIHTLDYKTQTKIINALRVYAST